jgi:hypothetical protein
MKSEEYNQIIFKVAPVYQSTIEITIDMTEKTATTLLIIETTIQVEMTLDQTPGEEIATNREAAVRLLIHETTNMMKRMTEKEKIIEGAEIENIAEIRIDIATGKDQGIDPQIDPERGSEIDPEIGPETILVDIVGIGKATRMTSGIHLRVQTRKLTANPKFKII